MSSGRWLERPEPPPGRQLPASRILRRGAGPVRYAWRRPATARAIEAR